MNLAEQFNPVPPPNFKRNKPKRGAAGKFSPKVTKQIFEFDEYRCAYCRSYQIQSVPHHCYFKSQMGLGSFENGATVCTTCHDWAHCLCDGVNGEDRTEGRGWFESYSDRKLLLQEGA